MSLSAVAPPNVSTAVTPWPHCGDIYDDKLVLIETSPLR